MPPAKRMPLGLQARLIRTDLVAAGYEPELSDIRAFMDGSLSYPENRALVAKAFGYRPGTQRGAVPKNLDALTMQAGLWNRQQADRRRRAARVLKDAQGYGIWVDVVRGSPADHLARGGMIQTRMSGGRLQTYRN